MQNGTMNLIGNNAFVQALNSHTDLGAALTVEGYAAYSKEKSDHEKSRKRSHELLEKNTAQKRHVGDLEGRLARATTRLRSNLYASSDSEQ